MGIIYSITNIQNKKVYIGKTIRPLQVRWNEHKKDMYNPDKNDNKLYRAMNKYGVENFIIEILEENIPNDILGQKEQDYIKLYDSYYNGYNSTLSGEGESCVDIEELKKLYALGKSYSEIAKITGHTSKTVSTRLRQENLQSPYLHKGYLNKGKQICFNDQIFDSLTLLAKYLQENIEIFKNKQLSTIIKGISKNAKNNKPYCGYYFNYFNP